MIICIDNLLNFGRQAILHLASSIGQCLPPLRPALGKVNLSTPSDPSFGVSIGFCKVAVKNPDVYLSLFGSIRP